MLESNNYWRCPAIFLGGAGYCILVDPTHWSGEGCHLKACKGYSVAEGQSWPGVRRSLQGAGPLSSVAGGKRGHFLPTSMKGQCSEHGWSFFEIGVALRATQINRNKPVRGDLWGYSTWEQAPVLQLENPAISPWLLPGPTGVFFPPDGRCSSCSIHSHDNAGPSSSFIVQKFGAFMAVSENGGLNMT